MFSAIGLTLDLVGAIALTLGLYTHSRYLTVGLRRGPDDVAQDAAFGGVGAAFLASGFVLQGLQYVGVTWNACVPQVAAAAGITLVLATIIGWLAFGLIYIEVYRRERIWVDKNLTEVSMPSSRRVPRGRYGWRFWHHKYDVPSS